MDIDVYIDVVQVLNIRCYILHIRHQVFDLDTDIHIGTLVDIHIHVDIHVDLDAGFDMRIDMDIETDI